MTSELRRYIASKIDDSTLDGHLWIIPDGWTLPGTGRPRRCRSCRAWVMFLVNEKTGKASPFDFVPNVHKSDPSVSHFATCPDASRWRKSRAVA